MDRLKVNVVIAVVLTVGCLRASAATPIYHLTDLGTLGGNSSYANGINNLGQVVGYSFTATDHSNAHAFVYSNGTMTDLGQPYGGYTAAYSINSSGQIAGEGDNLSGSIEHGFLYANGGFVDLRLVGIAAASAVNSFGQIAGTNTSNHAVLYQSGQVTDMGTLGGSTSSSGGLNDNGQAVGESRTGSVDAFGTAVTHAFLYQNGHMTDIGSLGGTYCGATAINANGSAIVGDGYMVPYVPGGANTTHAFLYSNGSILDIAPFGSENSAAYGVNSESQVVGYLGSNASVYANGTWINLNSALDSSGSGWNLQVATDINDYGWISGYGVTNGQTHAFLLTPLPEPSSLGFIGMIAMIYGRRRCRKSPQGGICICSA